MSTTPDAVPARDAAMPDRTAPHDAEPHDAVAHVTGPHATGPHATGPHTSGPHDASPTVPGPTPTPAVDPARRRRLLQVVAGLAVVVLLVDQLTKLWAVRALTPGERTAVVGDLLGLSLIYNPGAALSIATGMTWVLTVIAVVVVAVTVRASRRIGSRGWAVALGLLLGGAVGNLVDRFFREPGVARGHVVDFLAYGQLFVGNVADIAIVGAAGLIVVLAMRGIGLDGSRESDARAAAAGAPQDHEPGGATAPLDGPRDEPRDDRRDEPRA